MTEAVASDIELKMKKTLKKMAEFMAIYETTDEKFKDREQALLDTVEASEYKIQTQIQQIQRSFKDQELKIEQRMHELSDLMTEVGAARLRQSLSAGELHVQNIKSATQEFVKQSGTVMQNLEKKTGASLKNINKTLHQFKTDDFQQVANQSVGQIRQTCNIAIKKVNEVVRWFHWRNIAMAVSITIIVTMMTGLYLNDEWPWESHQQVMQQRNLANAVIASWSHLSSLDQQEILKSAGNDIA